MTNDRFIHSLDDVREEQEALLERRQDPDFALASDYAVGALDAAQETEVRARIERDPAFRDLVEPLLLLNERGPALQRPTRQETETGWRRLLDRVRRSSDDPQVIQSLAVAREARSRRRVRLWSVAAVIGLFVLLPSIGLIVDFVREATHRVPPGSVEVVDLGLGAKATIASGSRIIHDVSQPDYQSYAFTGEGEFDIAPRGGVPFRLRMRGAEVVVTGTKFRVHGYDHEPADVTVIEGTVQVWGVDDDGGRIGQPITLNAGERARAHRTKLPEKLP